MKLHELQELDFDEALSLLETQIIEANKRIQSAEAGATAEHKGLIDDLHRHRSDLEEQMKRLRELKAEELAGEKDNLLTEILRILDQIGEKIDRVLGGI